MAVPKINKTTFEDLVERMADLGRSNILEWNVPTGTPETWPTTDPGLALLKIFAKMDEEVISRLNRVPIKNFEAFLDMIGIMLMPAQPASVPITFYPVDGFANPIFVTAGTSVEAPKTEAHSALTYQTQENFSACDAPIVAMYCMDPDSASDKIYDNMPDLTANKPFQPFGASGSDLQKHMLYLGHSKLFQVAGSTDILLKFVFAGQNDLAGSVVWEYTGEDGAVKTITSSWETDNLRLKDVGVIKETEVNGVSSLWISGRFTEPCLSQIQDIKIIDLDSTVSGATDHRTVVLDYAFYDFIALDVKTKGPANQELENNIYPFGRKPRFFDVFYIANTEVFSKAGADIEVVFTLADPKPISPSAGYPAVDAELTWEYFDGSVWRILSPTIDTADANDTNTKNLWDDQGTLKFTLPADIQKCEVNGVENYWLRATITKGDYGREMLVPDSSTPPKYSVEEKFTPPCLSKVTISLISSNMNDSDKSESLEHCLSYNNLTYADITSRIASKTEIDPIGFKPFNPLPGTGENRIILLGFKNAFLDGNISLFFYVDESQVPSSRPPVKWSYWGGDIRLEEIGVDSTSNTTKLLLQSIKGFGLKTELMIQESITPDAGNPFVVSESALIEDILDDGWVVLDRVLNHPFTTDATVTRRIYMQFLDNTDDLASSDTLQFISPGDQDKATLFGNECYWLMGSLEGSGDVPYILGIYPNTVWALQEETVAEEILGSSDGEQDMTLTFQKTPVISCEIWVLEGIVFSEDDKAELPTEVSIQEVTDESGNVVNTWVKWVQVDDLFESDGTSRHYLLDSAMGQVTFGDGDLGMIPPIGTSNIKAKYTWGGGVAGNVSAGEIKSLRDALAGIDKVANCQPAEGGSDTEVMSSVLDRGPHVIRHRNRAVTKEDYERLAKDSSSFIARTKCISNGNLLNIIVIPKGTEDRPTPSQGLLDNVKKYLLVRCACSIPETSLQVIGPTYKDVRISVDIYPTSIDQAVPVKKAVQQRLNQYLHPLTGGPNGTGWDFGRSVYRSDLYSMLESISGVDHAENLTINEGAEDLTSGSMEIICSGNHTVKIMLGA